MLGVIFIIGYILILNSIDPNIIYTNNPVGVNATRSLLFCGFILIGGIGWLRAFFLKGGLNLPRGSPKGDNSYVTPK